MNHGMTTPDFLNLLTVMLLAAATGICLFGPSSSEKSHKSLPALAALLIATFASPRPLAPWIAALALVLAISSLPRFRRG
jgi:hypothetical protein